MSLLDTPRSSFFYGNRVNDDAIRYYMLYDDNATEFTTGVSLPFLPGAIVAGLGKARSTRMTNTVTMAYGLAFRAIANILGYNEFRALLGAEAVDQLEAAMAQGGYAFGQRFTMRIGMSSVTMPMLWGQVPAMPAAKHPIVARFLGTQFVPARVG